PIESSAHPSKKMKRPLSTIATSPRRSACHPAMNHAHGDDGLVRTHTDVWMRISNRLTRAIRDGGRTNRVAMLRRHMEISRSAKHHAMLA
ncbi:MAG: hypothetical protein VB141_09145, partial [Burkholderia gladioli]